MNQINRQINQSQIVLSNPVDQAGMVGHSGSFAQSDAYLDDGGDHYINSINYIDRDLDQEYEQYDQFNQFSEQFSEFEQSNNQLLTVQFDQRRNRLEILAQRAFVPQMYVSHSSDLSGTSNISNRAGSLERSEPPPQPQQLWIDLPNVSVDRASLQQQVGQTIKFIQVEPVNHASTRIWLEMAATVALKPHLIELQPQAPNYWFVQLANWRSMCDRQYSGRHPPRLNYVLPLVGEIRVGYGWRIHPVFKDWQFHRGIDIAAPLGTPIVAAAAGKVDFVGWNNTGYGNLLVLEHSDRSKTLYAHNHKILVRQGEYVEAGKAIALTGSTGKSIESHLHFELLPDGRHTANPIDYLPTMTRAEFDLTHQKSRAFKPFRPALKPTQRLINLVNTASIATDPQLASDQTAIDVISNDFLAI
jgi:murein DD-endopeptidase MepM/ murein hydrolase activator NlpD